MAKKPLDALENPDIDLTVKLKARELRFDEVPKTEVRFWGYSDHESVSGTERKNLPNNVREGVTYRDFSLQLRIASELVDTETTLSEKAKKE